MVCPKCGAMVNDNVSVCDNCGYEFETATAAAETDGSEYISNAPALPDAFKEHHRRVISFKEFVAYACVIIIAAMIAIFAFYGASYIGAAGKSINAIQSSGTSIFGFSAGFDSSFYMYMGAAIYGLSYVLRAIGVALAAITAFLGIGIVRKYV